MSFHTLCSECFTCFYKTFPSQVLLWFELRSCLVRVYRRMQLPLFLESSAQKHIPSPLLVMVEVL